MKKTKAELVAEMKRLRAALEDFRDYGTRFDLGPTEGFSFSHADKAGFDSYAKGYNKSTAFYQAYLRRVDREVRDRAAVALGDKTWAQVAEEVA